VCISFYEPSGKRPITLRSSQVTLELWAHSEEPASCHPSERLKFGVAAYKSSPSNEGIRTCTPPPLHTHTHNPTRVFESLYCLVSYSSNARLRLCPPQPDVCTILLVVSHPGTLRQWKSDARACIECHEETYTCHLVKLLSSDTARCKHIACLSVCRSGCFSFSSVT